MFQFISKKLIALCLAGAPMVAAACVESNIASVNVERSYQGISSIPVMHYLNLDSTCDGRRLDRIVMWASSSGGPGSATLLVNGRPSGVTQRGSETLIAHDFPVDIRDNALGTDIIAMEIRLSGDFFVQRIEAHFVGAPDPADDYWSNYGTLLGSTPTMDTHMDSTAIPLVSDNNSFSRVVFVARDGDFDLHAVRINYVDGGTQVYGGALIETGTARRIDFPTCRPIASIIVVGNAACDCHPATLEVRGKMEVFTELMSPAPLLL